MKKYIIRMVLVASLMSLSFAVSARVYLGGAIAGSYSDSKSISTTSWSFGVQTELGYMLLDKWAFGARFSYGKSEKKVVAPYVNQTEINENAFTVRPYAAYAPLRRGNFALWAEFGLMFVPEHGDLRFTTYGAYVTPVLTYNLGKHLILKTNLDFVGLSVSGNSLGDFSFAGAFGGESDLSIGLVLKF